MSCECYSDIDALIKDQTGDPEATVDYAFMLSGRILPRIPYTYRKKKRDGRFNNKQTEGTIIPTYCPWCGVKYDRGAE